MVVAEAEALARDCREPKGTTRNNVDRMGQQSRAADHFRSSDPAHEKLQPPWTKQLPSTHPERWDGMIVIFVDPYLRIARRAELRTYPEFARASRCCLAWWEVEP